MVVPALASVATVTLVLGTPALGGRDAAVREMRASMRDGIRVD